MLSRNCEDQWGKRETDWQTDREIQRQTKRRTLSSFRRVCLIATYLNKNWSCMRWKQWIEMIIPGQLMRVTHGIVSLSGPSHSCPPWSGIGLSQILDRACTPSPHIAEQLDHLDQFDQPPSTSKQTSTTDPQITKLLSHLRLTRSVSLTASQSA